MDSGGKSKQIVKFCHLKVYGKLAHCLLVTEVVPESEI